jgi:hypothetical protein
MRKNYALYQFAFVAALIAIFSTSCTKNNGIDNNNIIRTPYTLYVSDSMGTMYHTNDGVNYTAVVFSTDGYIPRSIVISDTNLLWVKNNLYFTRNSGMNFNPSTGTFADSVQHPGNDFMVTPYAHWQSMMYQVEDQNRLYCSAVNTNMAQDSFGVVYNDSNGLVGRWKWDVMWDSAGATPPNNVIGPNIQITSFTYLNLSKKTIAYDYINNRVFHRDNRDAMWEETVMVTGLPHTAGQDSFYLCHINDRLIAVDYSAKDGAYYSDDLGANWTQYAGLPQNVHHLYCAFAPFNETILIGTDSLGLYECGPTSPVNTFVKSPLGLTGTNYTSVRGITAKSNTYKDGTMQKFIYIATSTGVYRRNDNGTWMQVRKGNYVAIQ